MMKKLLFPLLLLSVIFMNAQSVYEFQAENLAYQNLVGSTSLNNGEIWDDPEYTIPLGFNFTISTHTFSTIYIVEWSAGGVLSSVHSDNGILPLFVPIGQDIYSRYDRNGVSTSPISYKTEGTSGNRILKIEWNNLGFSDDSTQADFMNIQMWLYEGTNVIEYRYGPNSINNPYESFEGETGPNVGMLSSYDIDTDELIDTGYILTGNTSNPTVLIFGPGDEYEGGDLEGSIPNGTVYRFIPQPLSVVDHSKIDFQIYPNPTSDCLNIKSQAKDYKFSLYNSLGQKMEISKVESRIDVSSLTNGIYFIKIETKTGSTIKKFIKQ